MMQHEFGHILQYRSIGDAAYWKVIAPESLFSATIKTSSHHQFWTETWANYLANKYFGKTWIGGIDYPAKNISRFNLLKIRLVQIQSLIMAKPRGFI